MRGSSCQPQRYFQGLEKQIINNFPLLDSEQLQYLLEWFPPVFVQPQKEPCRKWWSVGRCPSTCCFAWSSAFFRQAQKSLAKLLPIVARWWTDRTASVTRFARSEKCNRIRILHIHELISITKALMSFRTFITIPAWILYVMSKRR